MEDKNIKQILKNSYKPIDKAEKSYNKLGYTLDKDLSRDDAHVFYDAHSNPNIVYRGSNTKNDWLNNLKLGFGFKDPTMESHIQLADQVNKKYGSKPDIFGHSRGGIIAERVNDANLGNNAYTYNKGVLPEDVFKSIKSNQTDYRTKGDVVSLPSYFQTGGTKQLIEPVIPIQDFLTSHSVDSFIK